MTKINIISFLSPNKKFHFSIFLIILLGLSILMSLAYNPLCPGQDFHFHFSRLNALIDSFIDKSFPYYIDYHSVDGYGYLTRLFYPDLILIPFAFIGQYIGGESAYRLMLFSMTILCGIITYYSVNKVYKNTLMASISSILYTFCTYRLIDVFHRAALGESLAFTFIPLVFLGMHFLIKDNYKKWYVLAIGFSLVIYTHLITSVLLTIIIGIFILIYNKSIRKESIRLKYFGFAILGTLLLSSHYIFPLLEQMLTSSFYYSTNNKMLTAENSDFAIHWLIWGLFSGGVQARQFIPGIGILLSVMICLRLVVKGKDERLRSVDILVIVGIILLFATTKYFPWGWHPFKLLNFIQLPWRLFLFVSFLFAVAGGFYFTKAIDNYKRQLLAIALLIMSTAFIIVNDANLYKDIRCTYGVYEDKKPENSYLLGGLEYFPSSVPSPEYIADRGKNTIISEYKTNNMYLFDRHGDVLSINVQAKTKDIIELPLLYYVGYSATFNGNQVDIHESKNGLLAVNIDQSGELKVQYTGTPIQRVSFWISGISLLIFATYWLNNKRKENKPASNLS